MQSPLDLAAAYFDADKFDDCERMCLDVLRAQPGHPLALGLLAAVANSRRNYRRAVTLADQAIAAAGGLAWIHVEKAAALNALGQHVKAAAAARAAVDIDPDVPRGYSLLARALMPGEPYRDLIQRVHDWIAPASYVEIGVATGATMALARPPCVCVGIDPKPALQNPVAAVTKIFPLASDDYFARRDLRTDLEADGAELAFIDGLHEFTQALRDFINLERFAQSNTVVLIHDCIPIDARTAIADRRTSFWTGDVWKLIAALLKWRPDLDVQSVATPPSGLGVVCRLDPASRILSDNYDAIVAEFAAQSPPETLADRRRRLAMTENDWGKIAARIARATGRKPPSGGKRFSPSP